MSQAPSRTAAIAARDLVFGYRPDGPSVVDRVSIALEPGRITVLAGPNGAGKTTVMRLLAGLLRPDHGRIVIDDRDLDVWTPRERARRIGFVPQSLDAIPACDVAAFVAGGRYAHLDFWRRPDSDDRRAVRDALAACGLSELATRDLATLSGGERQRTLVARTLAQDPAVVLCDEPTASLDIDHALAICDLLAALANQGRAVLFVTHALDVAAQYADRIVLLQRGAVVADGPPRTVLRHDVLAPVYGTRVYVTELPDGGGPLVFPRR